MKKPTPKPKTFWSIVNRDRQYRYGSLEGIPELFLRRYEAEHQNVDALNGDRVIKVNLYHPISNFQRKRL